MADECLTICSVSFKSASFLELNWELTRRLNPDALFNFVVVDNTPTKFRDALMNRTSGRFKVVDRVPIDNEQMFPKGYHHGAALNEIVRKVETRYVLILDPDFFIVRENWITDVLTHMNEGKYAFFGAPYCPIYEQKYRYFPTIMCAFIDLHQVDKESIDWCPGNRNPILSEKNQRLEARKAGVKLIKGSRWERFFKRPSYIGKVEDSGWKLYKDYYGSDFKVDCVKPVLKLPKHFKNKPGLTLIKRMRNQLLRWYDAPPFLPECYSIIPKNRGCYSMEGFSDLGYIDLIHKGGWEEHMWRGTPFAFHVRKHSRVKKLQTNMSNLEEVIKNLTSQVSC